MKPLSTLLGSIPPSATIAINDKAKALRAAGHDIISLAGGDPDFATPDHITQAAFAAIRAGERTTLPPAARPPCSRPSPPEQQRDYGLTLEPAKEVLVGPGGKFLIYAILAAISNPGDEIIVFEPYWVSYVPLVNLVGATPVTIPLRASTGFAITAEDLAAYITPRTKAILVNSPNNPTGRVLAGRGRGHP